MKYIIVLIVLAGLSLGVYWLQEERPEVRAENAPFPTLKVEHNYGNQTDNHAELQEAGVR